uniref:C-type lectin domain-containing protein n=1 Tax=Leptobrachium leishanense TaxID=445787 RepID=A0A8C5MSE5_9ANUR
MEHQFIQWFCSTYNSIALHSIKGHIFAYFLLLYWSDLYTLGMLFFPAAPRSSCPPGWFFYKANCYGYFRFRLSWSEAEFECASYGHGAHLASVMDDSEASIIGSHAFAYAATVDIWIGLHDPDPFYYHSLHHICKFQAFSFNRFFENSVLNFKLSSVHFFWGGVSPHLSACWVFPMAALRCDRRLVGFLRRG